ncbi:MAG: Flp family type IVb pilin [Dehalococcoidia bacterium]
MTLELRSARGAGRRRPAGEEGQSLAEYGLVIALIAAGCVAALTSFGSTIAGSAGFTSLPGTI